ncbi:parvulin-like peptidyl-prolyl isomerase [Roseimicrobium gellanilyticum]|uniref:Parvulin-like peptidyl-prolyl isomerase n=1 Tax=Roseimicrobium gellanilyticum TaxID=748857 RepID=A0A366HMS1_9BACT|nr:peptidylprolyl isomerase [Roseimicrobium gellanilyticum]RBP43622.1 parvulin-like peptidyl-prolyl isomerase [Roseimicrobium gellanilyticum]
MKAHLLLMSLLLLPAGSLLAAPPADDLILGSVATHQVQFKDIRASLAALPKYERETAMQDPALLGQMVRSLLVQKLVLERAAKENWEQSPEITAYVARMRETAISESYLQSTCAVPETYPGQEELAAAYEISKPALLVPRSYRLAQIFISNAKDAKPGEPEKKLDEVRKMLAKPGADFPAIATAHSQETNSASRGGEIGWLTENQIQPAILSRLPALSLNAISEPVRLEDGWHILKVLDVRESFTPTLDQVRPRLVSQMRAEKARANTQAYLAELVRDNPVAVNEVAVSQLATPPTKK